jgi:wyosine [tRNA(Phe)-imidazoG37] synthetase (radical SAM superfamily)
VYHSLTVEENKLRIKRFLPLKVVKITLHLQLIESAWCRVECLNCWLAGTDPESLIGEDRGINSKYI